MRGMWNSREVKDEVRNRNNKWIGKGAIIEEELYIQVSQTWIHHPGK